MKILKWVLPLIALIFLFNTNVRAADMKIGYVALLQAMYESTEGKATLEYLQNEAKKREAEVAKKSDEMVKLRTEIEEKEFYLECGDAASQGAGLPDEGRRDETTRQQTHPGIQQAKAG